MKAGSAMATATLTPSNTLLAALMCGEVYQPASPVTLDDTGLTETFVDALIGKHLLTRGRVAGRAIAEALCLPFTAVEPRLQSLRGRAIIAHATTSALNDFVYVLTDKGAAQAQEWMAACAYLGPAPVPMAEYVTSVEAQSIRAESPQRAQLERSFAGISVDPKMLDKLGPAVNSGAGLFLHGEPGNGKTTLAERIARCFGQTIWLPYALWIDGQVVKLYDPACHKPLADGDPAVVKGPHVDRRWARIRRPTVIAGGELTMELLEIRHNAAQNICEAPLQLKSNCGVFLIDDFGRQRIDPTDLLNRWIVPLEKGYDFLTLPTGQTIQVPFDQMIIFSTNLNPRDLVDEAFLRRLAYKIRVKDPSAEEFRQLFRLAARAGELEYDEAAVNHLIRKHYIAAQRPFRRCHPRDLLRHVRSYCAFFGLRPEMKPEYLDVVVETYFAEVD
jgi:predicted ATPase with chaperone activity